MNAASPCVYLWGDIINHKNVAARVNVTGVDPSRSGFEPGSRCPCERGDYHMSPHPHPHTDAFMHTTTHTCTRTHKMVKVSTHQQHCCTHTHVTTAELQTELHVSVHLCSVTSSCTTTCTCMLVHMLSVDASMVLKENRSQLNKTHRLHYCSVGTCALCSI